MIKRRTRAGLLEYVKEKQPAQCPVEAVEQKQLNAFCAVRVPKHYDSMWHTVNESGGSGDARYGGNLKSMGRKSGVADWVVAVPTEHHHGLFIELKRQNKKCGGPKKDQRDFLLRQEGLGYACAVAYGYEAALEVIADYLSGVDFRTL